VSDLISEEEFKVKKNLKLAEFTAKYVVAKALSENHYDFSKRFLYAGEAAQLRVQIDCVKSQSYDDYSKPKEGEKLIIGEQKLSDKQLSILNNLASNMESDK
jgi:hypothetical protein